MKLLEIDNMGIDISPGVTMSREVQRNNMEPPTQAGNILDPVVSLASGLSQQLWSIL